MSIKNYILPVVMCQISLIFEINKEQTTAFYGAVKRESLKIFAESGDSAVIGWAVWGKDKLCTAKSQPVRFPHKEMFGILYRTEEGKLDEWYGSDVKRKVFQYN